MLYILSQNKNLLVPLNKPIIIDSFTTVSGEEINAVRVFDYEDTFTLGDYGSRKRAEAIVVDIANAVSCGYPLYCMPRE